MGGSIFAKDLGPKTVEEQVEELAVIIQFPSQEIYQRAD
ncbi:hypothetical protein EV05_0463 [Prochlorococcus sp. MIT 0601]|nr:hypothetical protein EV05_0463 [Prochlorococcus sp. MIT 0601]